MKTITITLPLDQMEAVAYAMQLHSFARADKLTAIEKAPAQNPAYQKARIGNAARDFDRTFNAKEAIEAAIFAARDDLTTADKDCIVSML